jgi:DNA polymerase-3 subunit epsilon
MISRFAVLDFETTGLRAGDDRIIEVGVAIVADGVVVDTFAQLMSPGRRLPSFITSLTGITDAMVRNQPPPEEVMPRLRAFLGDLPCVAHNAGFDQRFFTAEMDLAGESHDRTFLCSLLLSRRLVHGATSHRLGALADFLGLKPPADFHAHRALDDVLLTCSLWRHLIELVQQHLGGRQPTMSEVQQLMRHSKAKIPHLLQSWSAATT